MSRPAELGDLGESVRPANGYGSNMKLNKAKAAAAAATLCLSACASEHVIALNSIAQMQVSTTKRADVTVIHLRGVYMSSLDAVGEARITKSSTNAVLVRVVRCRPSRTRHSRLDIGFVLDDSVDAVAFGDPQSIVWRRDAKDTDIESGR